MKNLIVLIFFCSFSISISAQITMVDKNYSIKAPKEDQPKIEPYDSLGPIEISSDINEFYKNKKYIGQKLFLPSNSEIRLFSTKITKYPIKNSKYANRIQLIEFRSKCPSEVWTNVYSPREEDVSGEEDVSIEPDIYRDGHYYIFINHFTSDSVSNRYYTITDIIPNSSDPVKYMEDRYVKGKKLSAFFDASNFNSNDSVICDSYDKRLNTDHCLIELRDDISGDTVYVDPNNKLISVGFYCKVKNLFEGKKFIYFSKSDGIRDFITGTQLTENENGTIFKCTSINIYKNSIVAILENEKVKMSQAISLFKEHDYSNLPNKYSQVNLDFEWLIDKKLFLEDDIDKFDNELAQRERKNLLNERKYKNASTINTIRHLQNCIQKYGQMKGTLVAHGEVVIGMTKAMCHDAWYPFYKVIKTETENVTTEIWTNAISSQKLYLINGIVKKIIKY